MTNNGAIRWSSCDSRQTQTKDGPVRVKRDQVDKLRFRVIPGILVICGLIVSIPSVYQYLLNFRTPVQIVEGKGIY